MTHAKMIDRKLSVILLVSMAAVLCVSGARAATVGFWEFSEKAPGVGNTVDNTAGAILDSSGNGNHATALGGIEYVDGVPTYRPDDTAARLDGVSNNDMFSAPGNAGADDFDFAGGFTIEWALKTNNVPAGVEYLMIRETGGEMWARTGSDGNVQIFINDGLGGGHDIFASGDVSINDGNWHHVAMVRDTAANGGEGRLELFIDYASVNFKDDLNSNGPINLEQNLDLLGRDLTSLRDETFTGDADFVRVSNTALTSTQFIRLVTPIPEPTSLVLLAGGGLLSLQRRRRLG